jgi:hypothetical protein
MVPSKPYRKTLDIRASWIQKKDWGGRQVVGDGARSSGWSSLRGGDEMRPLSGSVVFAMLTIGLGGFAVEGEEGAKGRVCVDVVLQCGGPLRPGGGICRVTPTNYSNYG